MPGSEPNDRASVSAQMARIDERTINTQTLVTDIKSSLIALQSSLDNKYVGKEEFRPIKMVVQGLVGAVLLAVLTALITLVVTKH